MPQSDSPATKTHNEEKDGCEVTLVPHILDIVPHHLHNGVAYKEALSTKGKSQHTESGGFICVCEKHADLHPYWITSR